MDKQNGTEDKIKDNNATEHGKIRAASRNHWHLYLAVASVNICTVNIGCMIGWTSPAEDFLVNRGVYPGPIDKDTWSWIAAVFSLGAMCGPIPLGFLTDRFGRRPCLLGVGIMSVISWMLIATANGPTMILIARVLGGMALAAHFALLSIYGGEISTDDMRSTLGASLGFCIAFGYLFSVSIGPYVPTQALAIICGILPVVFLSTFVFMPESPFFLAGKGDLEGAKKVLGWLRGNSSAAVEKELIDIQEALQEASAQRSPLTEKIKSLFFKKGNLKGFIISTGLITFPELTGITPIYFFAESIFRESGTSLNPAACAITIGVVQVIVSSGTVILTRFFCTKTLLIASAAGMGFGHAILGYYFFQKQNSSDISAMGVLPVVALLIYITSYCNGLSCLPWAIMSEVFENDVKATASCLASIICNLTSFFMAWKFATLLAVLTPAYTFWIFGANCAIACTFITLLVPNTRGKSLQEIQDELSGRVQTKTLNHC